MLPQGSEGCQQLFLLLQDRTNGSWREMLAFAMLAEKNSRLICRATYGKEPIWTRRTGDRFGDVSTNWKHATPFAGVSSGDPALAESDGKTDWRGYPGRSGTCPLVVDFGHASVV